MLTVEQLRQGMQSRTKRIVSTYAPFSPVSFQTTPADPIIKRVETVGKVQPHVKAKIIDVNGEIVPVGTPGELCIAGYLVQKGYFHSSPQIYPR